MPFQDKQTQISLHDMTEKLHSWEDTLRVQVRTRVYWPAVLMHGTVPAVAHIGFVIRWFCKHKISVNFLTFLSFLDVIFLVLCHFRCIKNVCTFACQYVSHNV